MQEGEWFELEVDVATFTQAPHHFISTTPQQDLPFRRSERDKAIKLAADIAADGKRPAIDETWNPAISVLITSCWSNDASRRPPLGQVMSSLSMIMSGSEGLITLASKMTQGSSLKNEADAHLAPGAMWCRIEIKPSHITLGKVLGHGAYSTVYKCRFQNKVTALKMFRNTTEEKAFKEIEITFSMRHPNIIGIYAWVQDKSEMITQIGMVLELADGGDLSGLYNEKGGTKYSFKLALKVVAGAAKGLAHMHSMPAPIVHRDVKSGNIMVFKDEGKIADCGESRRIDLDSTMTQTGSPLWAAVSLYSEMQEREREREAERERQASL